MDERSSRRVFLVASSVGGAGLLLGCRKNEAAQPEARDAAVQTTAAGKDDERGKDAKERKEDDEPETGAVEDLMREHGVIRRALVVYREAATRLRAKGASVPPDALRDAAKLLRGFAEDYHEKQLEETHLFPAVKRAGGAAASEIDTLIAQHQRGREITDYVIATTRDKIAAAAFEPLARALEGFARMYEEHAAREDTIVFPAWKKALSPKQLDEMGDLFEDIEHKTFGEDGFDAAVRKIGDVERAFGVELARFTPPPPPKP